MSTSTVSHSRCSYIHVHIHRYAYSQSILSSYFNHFLLRPIVLCATIPCKFTWHCINFSTVDRQEHQPMAFPLFPFNWMAFFHLTYSHTKLFQKCIFIPIYISVNTKSNVYLSWIPFIPYISSYTVYSLHIMPQETRT